MTRSPEETEALGEALGRALAEEGLGLLGGPGAVVALHGELGAGKTVLVRGVARGLGISDPVTSPSFTLHHEYGGEGAVPLLHHLDAWMAGREAAFLEAGGAEILAGGGVAAVEWAERVEPWLPLPRLAVHLRPRGPSEREAELELLGDPAARPDLVRVLVAAEEAAGAGPGGGRGDLDGATPP